MTSEQNKWFGLYSKHGSTSLLDDIFTKHATRYQNPIAKTKPLTIFVVALKVDYFSNVDIGETYAPINRQLTMVTLHALSIQIVLDVCCSRLPPFFFSFFFFFGCCCSLRPNSSYISEQFGSPNPITKLCHSYSHYTLTTHWDMWWVRISFAIPFNLSDSIKFQWLNLNVTDFSFLFLPSYCYVWRICVTILLTQHSMWLSSKEVRTRLNKHKQRGKKSVIVKIGF